MKNKLNPARILEIHESLVDLLHDIIKMWRSLSGKLNHHNLQSSQRDLILQKLPLKIFQNKKIAEKFADLSFQLNFCDQSIFHGFFFANENPRKFVEKQNMIFFTYFMFIWTKEDDYPRNVCPRRFFAQGEFWPRKFSPRRLLSKKGPLCQGDLFFQEDVYLFGTIV